MGGWCLYKSSRCIFKVILKQNSSFYKINLTIQCAYIYRCSITDYVEITDNTGVYTVCGNKKQSFESKLCSSEIYISYKATTTGIYRGFKIYYECKCLR